MTNPYSNLQCATLSSDATMLITGCENASLISWDLLPRQPTLHNGYTNSEVTLSKNYFRIFKNFRNEGPRNFKKTLILVLIVQQPKPKCVWVVARLPIRLNSTFFEIVSSTPSLYPKEFQKTLILAFEANSALSCQNGLLFSVF